MSDLSHDLNNTSATSELEKEGYCVIIIAQTETTKGVAQDVPLHIDVFHSEDVIGDEMLAPGAATSTHCPLFE